MRTRLLLAAALTLGLSRLAAAQGSTAALPPGARVRITVNVNGERERFTGDLLAMNRDSILYSSPGRQALPVDNLIRLEVTDGRERHPFVGMFIGAAVGGIALGTAAAIATVRSRAYAHQEYSTTNAFFLAGMVGATAGAPVGLVIGSFKIYERWTTVRIR